jgi:uncharacterized membrane protein HdeD (DUF308 family)
MKPSLLLILLGVVLGLFGILALVNPLAASIAVTTLVGVAFLIGGVVQLWLAFSDQTDPHRIWTGIVGAVALLAGISLLANPLGGMISLTLLLGVLFLMTGVARLIVAFRLRQTPVFWLLLLSGAASVLLGVLIFGNFAAAATTLLGLLLGVQLLAEGVALIALGLAARNL